MPEYNKLPVQASLAGGLHVHTYFKYNTLPVGVSAMISFWVKVQTYDIGGAVRTVHADPFQLSKAFDVLTP